MNNGISKRGYDIIMSQKSHRAEDNKKLENLRIYFCF